MVCVVDSGRLMAAPVGDRTRFDIALDAVVAVVAVADVVGDRAGAVAFSNNVRRRLAPRRAGGGLPPSTSEGGLPYSRAASPVAPSLSPHRNDWPAQVWAEYRHLTEDK